MWAPSDVPSGAKVSDALLCMLFRDDIQEWDRLCLRHWLNWIPFETINEFAPSSVDLVNFYAKHFATTRPNEIHKQLVQLAALRCVSAFVTTNYDCGVEEAAGGTSPIWPVVDPRSPVPAQAIPLFKIHGCITNPKTLVFRLVQEATLEAEKARYLHALLADRTLIVVGYSGIDFEICPAIAYSQAREVVWCYRSGSSPKDYETPGYQAIARRIPIRPFPVDLSTGLPWLLTHVSLSLSPGHNIDTDLAALLTEDDRIIWALRLASSIGYVTLAQRLLKASLFSSPSNRIAPECEKQRGFVLFHSGRYRDAARTFLRAARSARKAGDYEQYVQSLLEACDAWRTGGYYHRAVASFARAKLVALWRTSARITGRLALKEALLLKSATVALQLGRSTSGLSRILRRFVADLVHSRGRQLVTSARRHSAEAGQVFDQKQLEELESIFVPSQAAAAPALDGYGHLGYLSASTTLFRVRALKLPVPTSVGRETEERYELMCLLGNHPEAWKVAARMATITAGDAICKWERRMEEHQRRCEYTKWHRHRLLAWVRAGATVEKL
jgi:tetratricopeptide (TPR) repeat protein